MDGVSGIMHHQAAQQRRGRYAGNDAQKRRYRKPRAYEPHLPRHALAVAGLVQFREAAHSRERKSAARGRAEHFGGAGEKVGKSYACRADEQRGELVAHHGNEQSDDLHAAKQPRVFENMFVRGGRHLHYTPGRECPLIFL